LHLEDLKQKIGAPNATLEAITDEDLRQSQSLRSRVSEYKELFFYMAKDVKGSFKKPETTKEQKDIDGYQSA
jgi:hypothetical protein